jgi:hypothetical protein
MQPEPMHRTHPLIIRIAEQLTLHTGEHWQSMIEAERLNPRVVAPDGATITILPAPHDRITISGSFGAAYTAVPRGERHTITVSSARSAEAITSEIVHRLLPAYRASLSVANERHAAWMRDEEQRAATLTELIALAGVASWQENKFYNRLGRIAYTAEVYSSGVHFEKIGSVSVETAKKILAILADPANQ